MKLTLTLLAFLISIACSAQTDSLKNIDYSYADSLALNYPQKRYKSSNELAKNLTRKLTSQPEKYRTLFRWISDNIEYKVGLYGTDPDKVLKKRKAVCEGYAHLLKEMCEAVGIECEVVIGYAKSGEADEIYTSFKESNHAWSAVKLEGNWYLSDITWASGGLTKKRKKFMKNFKEVYFLTDPDFLILNHYPEDEKWLLTDKEYSKRTFKKSPVYYSDYLAGEIILINPPKGKVKRNLNLTLTSSKPIVRISIKFDGEENWRDVDFIQQEHSYTIDYKFDKTAKGSFVLFINREMVIGFVRG